MKQSQLKSTLLFALPVAAMLALGSQAVSQDSGSDAQAVEDHNETDGTMDAAKASHERMEKAMKGLKNAQRSLRGLLEDPKGNQVSILKELKSMEGFVMQAYQEPPPKLTGKEFTADQWHLHVIGYKSQMLTLQSTILDLQASAVKMDSEGLKTGYGKLNEGKKKGHNTYQDED